MRGTPVRSRLSLPLWILLFANVFIIVDYVLKRVSEHEVVTPADIHPPPEQVNPAPRIETVTVQAPVEIRKPVSEQPKACNYCQDPNSPCARFGERNLARSRQYEGPNARFHRVLRKAQSGQPITISVMGGSVTAGHGVTPDENWTSRFFQWWNTTFPHPDNEFVNGAVPAVTSEYYASCFLEHIPEHSDLILMELAINDMRNDFYAATYEWMLRTLLVLPKKPALLDLQIFALVFDSVANGGDMHLGFAAYYDIPTISLRNLIYGELLRDKELEKAYFYKTWDGTIDTRHISNRGHRMLSDLLIAYTQRQICAVEKASIQSTDEEEDGMRASEHPDTKFMPTWPQPDSIPRLRLLERYVHDKVTRDIHPQCFSTRSAKHPLVPSSSTGWSEWSWKDKKYLIAKEPGAKITFDIELQPEAVGLVRLTYLRSATFGLGDLGCWIDDNKKNMAVLHGYWEHKDLNLIQEGSVAGWPYPSPGPHKLHCEVLESTMDPNGGKEVRIVAMATL